VSGVGRPLLIWRLVRGDIKHRPVQSVLLLVMIAATTATLTLALTLRGVTDSPFARTREATKGPDVAALFQPGFHGTVGTREQFVALRDAPGVVASTGPYPMAPIWLEARGHQVRVHAEGRDRDQAAVDQPLLIAGRWVAGGGAVLERGLADALGLHVGDSILIGGRGLVVRGIALTTGLPTNDPLVWITRSTLITVAGHSQPLWYALNLKLSDPAHAPAFADARSTPNAAWFLEPWQSIRADDSQTISAEQQQLEMGSALLALIAVAGIAVLVGGRMAEQTRRVGLLKAVGATPGLVAVVLVAENLLLAIAGSIVGVAIGRVIAPALTSTGSSMLSSARSPALTPTTVVLAAALAIVVAAAATLPPALRGARTSTIRALNDPARPPTRQPRLIELSSRLPVPLLLSARLIARRPRRALLAIASVAIAVATLIATLMMRDTTVLGVKVAGNVLASARQDSLDHIGNLLSAILLVIAAINLLFTTWATVLDAERPTALARALGATPRQITAGLSGAQIAPALAAAIIGIPAGLVLYMAAGGNPAEANPPILALVGVIPATAIAVATLTSIPAHIAAQRPVADVLRSD
jgi:putative ABC transport system permease protein